MGFMDSLPRPVPTYHTKAYDGIAKEHNFSGHGRTIPITGGGSGLGLHIAKAFAEAGASRVAIVSRSADQQQSAQVELQSAYPRTDFVTYQASVTDYHAIQDVLTDLKTVDVLVLNAAIAHRRATASDLTEQDIRGAFQINTLATFNLAQAFLKLPPTSGPRSILNVASAVAHLITPYRAAYGSSKAASVQIMQALAAEYANDPSVRIFSFHPGSFYTPVVAAVMARDMYGVAWEDEGLAAGFSVWLAGPHSEFLKGRFVWANWDVDELLALKDRLTKEPSFLTIGLVQ